MNRPREPEQRKDDNLSIFVNELKNIEEIILRLYPTDQVKDKFDKMIGGLANVDAKKREKLNLNLDAVGLSGDLLKDKMMVWKELLEKGEMVLAAFIGSSIFQSYINASDKLIPNWLRFLFDFVSEYLVYKACKSDSDESPLNSNVPDKTVKKARINPFTGSSDTFR